jgi:hypothetical protein
MTAIVISPKDDFEQWRLKCNQIAAQLELISPGSSGIGSFQPLLVSGENIKTVNGQNVLGPGNLTVIADGVPPIPLAIPGISGNAQKGYTLNATSAQWVGLPTPSLSGIWQRNGVDIPGATTKSYTLVAADVGSYVSYKEIANNGVISTSNTISVMVADLPLPTVLTAPYIKGTPFKGQLIELIDGIYGHLGLTTGVVWEKDGVPTSNTSMTYLMSDADTGSVITVALTVENVSGSSVFRTAPVTGVGPLYDGTNLIPLAADPFMTLEHPAVGSTFVDPLYGMSILRGSDYTNDTAGATFIRQASSRQPVFNSDASMYLVKASNGLWILYDATANPLNVLDFIDAEAEPIWDTTSPNLIHYTNAYGGLIWYTVDVSTMDVVILHDFTVSVTTIFPEAARVWLRGGCPSADGNTWTFSIENANMIHLGLISWNFTTQSIISSVSASTHNGGSPEWVSTSPSGTYSVICWSGSNGTVAYTVSNFTSFRQIVTNAPYGDLCVGTSNEDIFCYLDEVNNALMGVNCAAGSPFVIMSLTWGIGLSKEIMKVTISGKSFDRPGWVFLSGYGEQYEDTTYQGKLNTIRAPWRKVFVTKLVPSGISYSIAYMQTSPDYGGSVGRPDAVPSRDGRKAIFTSNFGGQADPDVYIVSIPDKLVKGDPSVPIFMSDPSISCPSGIFQTGQMFVCNSGAVDGEPFPSIHYQWKIDGVDVGTDSASFTPSTAGVLSCYVTIQNSQGQANRTSQSISIVAPAQALTVPRIRTNLVASTNAHVYMPPDMMQVWADDLVIISAAYSFVTMTAEPTMSDPTGINTIVGLPAIKCPDRNNIVKIWYCLRAAAGFFEFDINSSTITTNAEINMRISTYSPGAGHHFEFDTYASIGSGYAYGDIVTPAFNTSDQGVIYTAFSDDYYSKDPFPFPAPTGFTYFANIDRPLVAADMITATAKSNVVGTKPSGNDYTRGEVQSVSFVTKPN